MSDDDKVLAFPFEKFVRFYKDYVECDFCGQLTRGRVYDGAQEIVCGACNSSIYEFYTSDCEVTFEPEANE